MRILYCLPVVAAMLLAGFINYAPSKEISLFDGKTFKGWSGDTVKTWRIEKGELIGGSLTETVPHNEFISTTRSYSNYVLKVKFKLLGTDGFINTGVQFHSQHATNPVYEMVGYQADLGDGFWGCIYDESRRNKIVGQADTNVIKRVLRRGQWNEYEIWSEKGRTRVKLNGVQTVDYVEPDKNIPQSGLIAFQIHGGGKAEVHYKDITLKRLP
ncbi:MAG: DUF1080 domain-containing protein [Sphingobacteriales bacterium]|nr:MAG: DUF1080 domain-containing protein [Sphingobacteriales bacterium]